MESVAVRLAAKKALVIDVKRVRGKSLKTSYRGASRVNRASLSPPFPQARLPAPSVRAAPTPGRKPSSRRVFPTGISRSQQEGRYQKSYQAKEAEQYPTAKE